MGNDNTHMSTGNKGAIGTFFDELDPVVYGIGLGVSVLAIIALVLSPEASRNFINNAFTWMTTSLGWAYLMVGFFLVVFGLFLLLGPWGNIRIGKPDEDPEHSFKSYFAMLYSAGIAAGIVFWGPAEAVSHYTLYAPPSNSPLAGAADPGTPAAAVDAVAYTFFHWGISAWSFYVLLALPIAFFAYRYGAPLRISTVLAPFLGTDNLDGWLPKLIDITGVFATIGGIATSLGFVGGQFLGGLNYIFGIQTTDMLTILMITGLTVAFTLSAALGVEKGIKRVSNFNMVVFFFLMVVAFVFGPTAYILDLGVESIGQYVNNFISVSMYTNSAGFDPAGFVGAWTVFYWAWWFAWAPFVGLFIARISRGRTVRQMVGTGVIASTGATIPWFAALGGSSIWMENNGVAPIVETYNNIGYDGLGYPLFEAMLPGALGVFLMLTFLLLVTTFFVTSADSSTLALGMLTTGGKEKPSTINRTIWGVTMGLLAALLLVFGGANALQTASVLTGGPFAIVLLIAVWATIRTFRHVEPVFLTQKEVDQRGSGIDPSEGIGTDDD
ncbi:choline/carnitine/betaine transporter [Halodesulfurarchaeum formicicum]|uniref:Choline/carnitine/betaine transporter n=2 Tax=Halodesulfurarchaeum formicicum TaxID=1873524 RepID=A0A1D8S6C9_9EURY|nr:choline/carnitine/betaine transporter [Halodesulfurarchaeum formicicum]APE96255.1 choline/carnitine/betaine transporter [Halodesulfurarchaeum formicicum]